MSTAQTTNNPHHEGKQSLEFKPDGENSKVMRIKPYELRIIWGKDIRYWNVPTAEDDNDERPAELYQVSWLEVTVCVSATEPQKEYELGFEISLTPDAFGWSGSPVYILVKRGKNGKYKGHKFQLDTQKETLDFPIKAIIPKLETADTNSDVDADENSKIYFGLYEVWRGKWKGGLKIHHAFIRELESN